MISGKQTGFPSRELDKGDCISVYDFSAQENRVAGLQDTKRKVLLQPLSLKKAENNGN